MLPKPPTILFAVIAALTFAAVGQARVVTPVPGCTFQIPDDWQEIPRDQLAPITQGFKTKDPLMSAVAGFEPASHAKPFQPPYLIVAARTRAPSDPQLLTMSEPELQHAVARYFGTTDTNVPRGPEPSKPQLNLNANRSGTYFTSPPGYIAEMDIQGADGLRHAHSVCFLTRQGSVTLNFTDLKSDFAAIEPVINTAASSFKIDADHEVLFIPNIALPASPGDAHSRLVFWLIISGFITAISIMILATIKLLRRRT